MKEAKYCQKQHICWLVRKTNVGVYVLYAKITGHVPGNIEQVEHPSFISSKHRIATADWKSVVHLQHHLPNVFLPCPIKSANSNPPLRGVFLLI